MSDFLNDSTVKNALHTTNTWVSTDETGPVAKSLIKDMEQGFVGLIDSLLDGGIKWLM